MVHDSYLSLIREFPLRRITSPDEHADAIQILRRLSAETGDRGVTEYRDVLVDLVVDYERKAGWAIDTSDVTARELIQFRLEESGTSVSALAREVGLPQSNLSEMLNGKRGWSKSAIRLLAKKFNIAAERFLV